MIRPVARHQASKWMSVNDVRWQQFVRACQKLPAGTLAQMRELIAARNLKSSTTGETFFLHQVGQPGQAALQGVAGGNTDSGPVIQQLLEILPPEVASGRHPEYSVYQVRFLRAGASEAVLMLMLGVKSFPDEATELFLFAYDPMTSENWEIFKNRT
ncbi:MAG: hypothetical protein JW873_01985 [Candidatus Saganbacteria bacterium]|nr:hypothetical protein [Candidatus Saganbacteria bacterium]